MANASTQPVAVERRGANMDAPDANYSGAHVRVIGRHVILYTPDGSVHREYEFDEDPKHRGGKVVGTVGGEPLTIDRGCGCRNKPFMASPKGVQS